MNLINFQILSILLAVFSFSSCSSLSGGGDKTVRKEIHDDNYLAQRGDAGPRKRIVVLPFLDASDIRGEELRDEARQDFIRSLNMTGAVIALDSRELKVDFVKSIKNGEYDMEALSKVARSLGVHSLLEGKILDIKVKRKSDAVGIFRQVKSQFEAKVRVRIATVRGGREIFNTVKTVMLEEGNVRVAENVDSDRYLTNNPELVKKLMSDAFQDFTRQIVESLDRTQWEGRIAMVNGDRIFLNVGKISGLQIGDLLKVTEDGDEIYDPQSGNFVGKTPGRMKGTLEVVSFFGQDGAITVIHSGAGFKENDRVEMY